MSTISQYHELGSPAQPVSQPTGQSLRTFLASVASHLALVGFLVMPLAFGDEPHVNKTVTVIVSSVLIGIAYSLSLFLVLLHFDERMYLIQSLLVPCLVSNTLALFNVLINILCRDLLPLGLLEILCLSFSAAFAFLYTLCALWLYSRDVNEAVGNANRGTILLTDEEMQRQQLQRLLEQNSSRKSLSPRAVQKTYRVNHPDRLNSFLPTPNEEGYFS